MRTILSLGPASLLACSLAATAWAQAEITPPAAGVTASTHDGNVPANAVDGSLSTRWSANGDGQWLRFDLGAITTVGHARIAFYNGNTRRSHFDLQVSSDGTTWTNVLAAAASSGTTTQEETFDFSDTPARWFRYVGHGNSVNLWNSVTELSLFGAAPAPTPTPGSGAVDLTPDASGVTADTHDGNLPANTIDGSLATRWSANGDGRWIRYDLGAVHTVSHVDIAFYNGNTRRHRFDLEVSSDGGTWTRVLTLATSSGTTTQEERFDFADAGGRYVRYVGHGNDVNPWNSLTEVSVLGFACSTCPTPTPTDVPPATPTPTPTATPGPTTGVTLCILGDSGIGSSATATHQLCQSSGADAIVHTGDLDYENSPSKWQSFMNANVPSSLPYFMVLGNHDVGQASGYRTSYGNRLNSLGIPWTGTLATRSTIDWRGLRLLFTYPESDDTAAAYIRDQAAATSVPWVLSFHHHQQHMMQVGGKSDATGWGVFEEARKQGVVPFNGHEHSYGRTHVLSNMQSQTIADNTSPYDVGRGTTMVVQTGLGGRSIREQGSQASLPYWAKVYTTDQGATYGVSLCTFGAQGDPRRADCTFKNTRGATIDSWTMFSRR